MAETIHFRRRGGARLISCALTMVFLAGFAAPSMALGVSKPDFGPNVLIFDPSMPAAAIQKQIDRVFEAQYNNEFSQGRNALLFLPGSYKVNVGVGYYTQVLGLGATPDAVHIYGNLHSDGVGYRYMALGNFWRSAEGLSVTPSNGAVQWAVSQAAPLRRMHIEGNLALHQLMGWTSGGWMSDTVVNGSIDSGSQQQWISRNCEWGSWTGYNWNMVFVGVPTAPAGDWPSPPFTKVAKTPISREKPYLLVDARGNYFVRVPALRTDSAGVTWHGGSTPGESVSIDRFYIAHPGDTAEAINAQLAAGKHLLITPGTYELTEPIRVTRPGTVVMGLGFATLRPVNGNAALVTADADGIILAGLLIEAGETRSPVLLQVGPQGSQADHAKNPIFVIDVFFREGGNIAGKAGINLEINSYHTVVDHTWIWRADHGKGVGWNSNTSDNGLVVNGEYVTVYGLFVEHHQQFQVLWRGNRGRTYFYQSEIPYDAPDQASYTSAPGVNGWASYKVDDYVSNHEAWGLGIYSVFRHPNIVLSRAIETPIVPAIHFHHMITLALGERGEISNVIDDVGGATATSPRKACMVNEFPEISRAK